MSDKDLRSTTIGFGAAGLLMIIGVIFTEGNAADFFATATAICFLTALSLIGYRMTFYSE